MYCSRSDLLECLSDSLLYEIGSGSNSAAEGRSGTYGYAGWSCKDSGHIC